MKLMRHGPPGSERPTVLDAEGQARDASSLVPDWNGAALDRQVLAAVAEQVHGLPLVEPGQRIGAPVAQPTKVVCIGLNYRDHIAETGAEVPDEPVVFMKDPSTVVGPTDVVLLPRGSVKTDYEVELAVVIGRTARYLESDAEARRCIAGYAVSNDLSERAFQLERGGQWDKGKSCETFNPLGPWLVTADEVPDPQDLVLTLRVGEELRQSSSTGEMVFGVLEIVRYLSHFMVLHPGDVINTGTPSGVALGRPGPSSYLADGDVVAAAISGLGAQQNPVRRA